MSKILKIIVIDQPHCCRTEENLKGKTSENSEKIYNTKLIIISIILSASLGNAFTLDTKKAGLGSLLLWCGFL